MFDRYTLASGDGHTNVNVKITEKRVPTDDSVRLLREMEAAAREQVIEAISVGDTAFECVVHYQQRMMEDKDKDELVAIFSLNGRKMEARFIQDRGARLMQMRWRHELVDGLIEAVAKKIATEILRGALSQMQNQVGSRI